jgi:16S rRNA (adenine1518-N6/adenine1519-N6)-dimethyltransferase
MSQFRAKKRLGQNFLSDRRILEAIVEAAELSKEDRVLEIGPGQGVLTRELAGQAGKVVAVELDRDLVPILEPLQREFPNLDLVWADFLKVSWEDLGLPETGTKVVANIPYYITTPILLKLLHEEELSKKPFSALTGRVSDILLMVQAEVADRLNAKPGTKDYGSITVLVQYAATVETVVKVPRTAFKPAPKVDSKVIRIRPRQTPLIDVRDPKVFFRVVRAAFNQRRKTLLNALSMSFDKDRLRAAEAATGVSLTRRGETLSLDEFATLANALS